MTPFKSNKITAGIDTISEQLCNARRKRNIELEDVAEHLGINCTYLKALEESAFNKLPTGIYGRNFLREYAQYLKLNVEELLEIFDNEINLKQNNICEKLFIQRRAKNNYFLTILKLLKNIVALTVMILCFIYLGFYLKNIVSPPELIINSPIKNFITNEHSIKVAGTTEPEAQIIINGASVLSTPEGYFDKEINLKNGINLITITAKKKYSRENIIKRQILVKSN